MLADRQTDGLITILRALQPGRSNKHQLGRMTYRASLGRFDTLDHRHVMAAERIPAFSVSLLVVVPGQERVFAPVTFRRFDLHVHVVIVHLTVAVVAVCVVVLVALLIVVVVLRRRRAAELHNRQRCTPSDSHYIKALYSEWPQ